MISALETLTEHVRLVCKHASGLGGVTRVRTCVTAAECDSCDGRLTMLHHTASRQTVTLRVRYRWTYACSTTLSIPLRGSVLLR